ncbi:hypothetical protein BMETH_160_4 [methanotrophic bacterial endosymbiont of Bathymodiolus sp.]|nr:hypothetical protein BMETH_160_4 [methanotrophic bacterial endosymbiont of Bathymodiolus sp.]
MHLASLVAKCIKKTQQNHREVRFMYLRVAAILSRLRLIENVAY